MAAILKRRLLSIGSPSGVVAAFLGRLLTTRGQIIRRGASGVEAFQANTANQLLGGDGTDIGLRTPAQVRTTLDLVTGVYTPSLTNGANIDSTTAFETAYYRIVDRVTVFGKIQADATAAASTSTTVNMSLPIASNFSQQHHLAGTGYLFNNGVPARIVASTANNNAEFRWLSAVTTNQDVFFHLSYRII